MKSTKLVPLVAAMLVALPGVSHALPYSASYQNFTNGLITVNGGTPIVPSTVQSDTSATLGGFAPVVNGGAGVTDAAPAQLGDSAKANNDFTLLGPVGNYSRGDSQIISQQTLGDPFTQVVNIAEASLDMDNSASSTARNASDTSIEFTIGGAGGTVDFAFDTDPFLQVIMPAGLVTPSVARAEITVNLSITDSAGDIVWSWTPDGVNGGAGGIGGTVGGNELLDPFSLNRVISRNFANPGTTTYDPTADASVGTLAPAGLLSYSANTNLLNAGLYTIVLQTRETSDVVRLTEGVVPEPASLGLLGVGLAGLGAMGRRKRK